VGAKPARARGEGRIVIRECNAVFPPAGAADSAARARASAVAVLAEGTARAWWPPGGAGTTTTTTRVARAPSWQECEVRAASARDHASAVPDPPPEGRRPGRPPAADAM